MLPTLHKWWNALSPVDQLVLAHSWNQNPVPGLAISVLRRTGIHVEGSEWQLREVRGQLYWPPNLRQFVGERAGLMDWRRS
jgi:hypothetical protein